jgi:hypothetical protein
VKKLIEKGSVVKGPHQQSRGGRIGASMQMTMLLADLPRRKAPQEIEGQQIVDRP